MLFVFFKQKTAYEMLISDWSSDVCSSDLPDVSRMTIVVSVEQSPLEQVTKQLNKLVEVIKIVELDTGASVSRELVLVKVRADTESRGQVLDAVQLFKAKVIDVAPDALTIQVTGNADKLADFLREIGRAHVCT